MFVTKITYVTMTGCSDLRMHEEATRRLLASVGMSQGAINSVRAEAVTEQPGGEFPPWLHRAVLALLRHKDRVEALALIRGARDCDLEEAKRQIYRMLYGG